MSYPARIFLFKAKSKKITRRQWPRFGVFIVNFKYVSHFFLVLLLLTLDK